MNGYRCLTAAVLMVVGGAAVSAWNASMIHIRHNAGKKQCQMKMARIYQGLTDYKNDHDNKLPDVALAEGSPYWMVGLQDDKSSSNTRPLWKIVKDGYVKPSSFLCSSRNNLSPLDLNDDQIKNYHDFPGRAYITYSFQVNCSKTTREMKTRRAILADLSPLFEQIPNHTSQFVIQLNTQLKNSNSINHHRRGQNVLFCDGSVEYSKTRKVGINQDDIYTLANTTLYTGVEQSTSEFDRFLAP